LGSICPRAAGDASKQGMFLLKEEGSLQKQNDVKSNKYGTNLY
jgi:hypothetical protein